MRKFILLAALLSATCLLSACGGESKQAEPTAEPGQTGAPEPAAPVPAARPASFGLCAMCHSDEAGRNGLGPSLFGVVGRQSGAVPGYSYSPAMKSANLSWDEAVIDRYLQDPRAVVPGTKMTFAGVKDAEKRAEIIAYLATLK